MKFLNIMAGMVIKLNAEGETEEDRMDQVNTRFIVLYAAVTVFLIYLLLSRNYGMAYGRTVSQDDRIKLGRTLSVYFLYIISLFSIHLWIYLARRFYIGIQGGNSFLKPNASDISPIWRDSQYWFEPFPIPRKGSKIHHTIVKIVYTVAWIAVMGVIIYCTNRMGLFEFTEIVISIEEGGIVKHIVLLGGLVLYVLSMIMNYFSYFLCIAFTIFIGNVSHNAAEIRFNHRKPSSTICFHQLVHASSRVAVSFFCDSMLYVFLFALEIWIGEHFGILSDDDNMEIAIISMCIVLLCILSYVVVFLLPKAFLSRLLRKWKFETARDIESGFSERYENVQKDEQERLSMIYSDRLPLIKTELVIAVIAIVVDVISIFITLGV